LIDWGLASLAQCTLYGNPRTVDRNSWKRLQIAIDVLTQTIVAGTMPVYDCLAILTLLTLHVRNYTILYANCA